MALKFTTLSNHYLKGGEGSQCSALASGLASNGAFCIHSFSPLEHLDLLYGPWLSQNNNSDRQQFQVH